MVETEYMAYIVSRVRECYQLVMDEIQSGKIEWKCNWGNKLEFRFYDYNITEPITESIVDRTCR